MKSDIGRGSRMLPSSGSKLAKRIAAGVSRRYSLRSSHSCWRSAETPSQTFAGGHMAPARSALSRTLFALMYSRIRAARLVSGWYVWCGVSIITEKILPSHSSRTKSANRSVIEPGKVFSPFFFPSKRFPLWFKNLYFFPVPRFKGRRVPIHLFSPWEKKTPRPLVACYQYPPSLPVFRLGGGRGFPARVRPLIGGFFLIVGRVFLSESPARGFGSDWRCRPSARAPATPPGIFATAHGRRRRDRRRSCAAPALTLSRRKSLCVAQMR